MLISLYCAPPGGGGGMPPNPLEPVGSATPEPVGSRVPLPTLANEGTLLALGLGKAGGSYVGKSELPGPKYGPGPEL